MSRHSYEEFRNAHDAFLRGHEYEEHNDEREIPGMRLRRFIRDDGAVLCEDYEFSTREAMARDGSWEVERITTMHVEWFSYGAEDCDSTSRYCSVDVD